MFASERDGEFVVFKQTHLRGKNFGDHFIERAVGGVDSRKRVNPDLLVRLELEFLVVKLHIAAGGQDRGGPVARPVFVRSGALERHRKNHGARCCVLRMFVRKAAEIFGRHRSVSCHRRFRLALDSRSHAIHIQR